MITIFIFFSQKRNHILDGLIRKHNLDIDCVNSGDLSNFVNTNKSKIENASHIIIDLFSLIDNNNEIMKSIDILKQGHDKGIIVLADMMENRDNAVDLLSRMAKRKVYDMIRTPLTDHTEQQFETEFLYCLFTGKSESDYFRDSGIVENSDKNKKSSDGNQEISIQKAEPDLLAETNRIENQKQRERLTPNKSYREYKQYLIVAVAGTEPHIGVTHNALLITKFLKDVGFNACYVESGKEYKIFSLKNYYPNINVMEKKGCIQRERIDLFAGKAISDLLEYEYDIYVLDVGALTPENLSSFMYKDVHILVSGSKSWELNQLADSLNLINAKNAVNILFNLSLKENEKIILSGIGEYKKNAYFTEYVPNLFESNVNVGIYKDIFEKYLTTNGEEPKNVVVERKRRFLNLGRK